MNKTLGFLFASTVLASAQGTILWDESVHGPISRTPSFPTAFLSLGQGSSTVLSSVEAEPLNSSWLLQSDFFTFHVPPSLQLVAMQFEVDQPVIFWIGNASFSEPIGIVNHPSNGDLLLQMGISSLSGGDFGVYVSNDQLQPVRTFANYRLDFIVQPVPEPSTWALLALGGALFCFAIRRWRK